MARPSISLSDLMDNAEKVKPDDTLEDVPPPKSGVTTSSIDEAYFPELTSNLEATVERFIMLHYPALLLDGPPGCGKTHAVQKVCKEGNYNLLEFDTATDLSDPDIQLEITYQLQRKTSKTTVLFFDNFEYGRIPKGQFLSDLMKDLLIHGKTSNSAIIAATSDAWRFKAFAWLKSFQTERVRSPTVWQIKKAYMKLGVKVPNGIPRDLRAVKKILKSIIRGAKPDIYRPMTDNFAAFTDFMEKSPDERDHVPKMNPWLPRWIVANLFGQDVNVFLKPHELEFHAMLENISVADYYVPWREKILLCMPSRTARFGSVKHPSTIEKDIAGGNEE